MSVFDELASLFDEKADATDDIGLNEGTYQRRVVVIVIDVSGSMGYAENGKRPIDDLNSSIESWLPEVRSQGKGPLRGVEFAVVTFGGDGVRTVTGDLRCPPDRLHADGGAFVPAGELEIAPLTATGTTPMVAALEFALNLGDQRVQYLAGQGLQTGQVRMILFSDGGPNDDNLPAGAWRSTADLIRTRRKQRRLLFLAFGAPGADEHVLRELAPEKGYFPLSALDFNELLNLVLVATSADDPYAAVWEQARWGTDGQPSGESGAQ